MQFIMFVPAEYLTHEIRRVSDLLRGDGSKEEARLFLGRFKEIPKEQGSRANPAERFAWEKEEQRNGRDLPPQVAAG